MRDREKSKAGIIHGREPGGKPEMHEDVSDLLVLKRHADNVQTAKQKQRQGTEQAKARASRGIAAAGLKGFVKTNRTSPCVKLNTRVPQLCQ